MILSIGSQRLGSIRAIELQDPKMTFQKGGPFSYPDFDSCEKKRFRSRGVNGTRRVCASRILIFFHAQQLGWRFEANGREELACIARNVGTDPEDIGFDRNRYSSDVDELAHGLLGGSVLWVP